jgi:hypothetical protein
MGETSFGARPRARLPRRGSGLRTLPLAAVAFLIVLNALFGSTWQLMPFPDAEAVLVAFLTGLAFGLAVHRWSALWLALLALPAGLGGEGGFFGGVIALLVTGPFALTGLAVGVFAFRRMQRVALRRMLARAHARPVAGNAGGLHAPPGLGA